MNTKLLVDRFLAWPLPESLCSDPCASMPGYPHRTGTNLMTAEQAEAMIEYVIAAPRQPEGDAISRERVQLEADAFFDWPTADKSSVTTTSCLIFARCIAGMVAAERDATIAELREECEHLRACQENAMLHMTGLVAERDTLRQQLADSDAALRESRANDTAAMGHLADMRQQRDKLAGLLREKFPRIDPEKPYPLDEVEHHCEYTLYQERERLHREIDAALAEVDK